ncbi:urea ABC transporter ATP-binding protein UrtD [Frankia sp. AgB1.9]|uniref:urea ABC transporter ATP-binding protein UrtD n=1 Tax=unclassified Frankia TaxID=2632575 RepID=UPI0019340FAB|nr:MULTISPECIES: urea ABC transporter ATP-binding protein UrtD [unclassified Frankia]MBL7491788.1 urea ABC transporter ATP-binding protein UrtD [Frankia sp. AgW1.1]MBL7550683.1 urea ABC transporter ATP-binding protein UrtD [Frankia sp. AgB1.9]MBL7621658.1 urea ABC transporter ATP-binding protein UrtD [Frankia sp. AgB1.8]
MTTDAPAPAPVDPPADAPADEALLAVRGLRVVFDGFVAIDGIDFTVNRGELRFLIGPNGAGKTTLVDVITGLTKPTSGSVTFAGTELVGQREHRIVRLGIGRTFQTATVFEELTVLENIDLAASFRTPVPALFRRRKGIGDRVAQVLETTQLTELASRKAGILSHGQRQWLEIGMLLAQDPRLLLLDEPVAGMTKDERERTGQLLQQIAREHTVVVIEHDMEFLRRFARLVTVLHEGKVLMEGTVAEVQADRRVQEVYLGRASEEAGGPVAAAAELEAAP